MDKLEARVKQLNKAAMEYVRARQYEAACKQLTKANRLLQTGQLPKSLFVMTQNNMGCLAKRLREYTQALHHFTQALHADSPDSPSSGSTCLNLCVVHSLLGDHAEAARFAVKAIGVFRKTPGPSLARAYYNAGVQYKFLNDPAVAQEFLAHALILASKHTEKRFACKVQDELQTLKPRSKAKFLVLPLTRHSSNTPARRLTSKGEIVTPVAPRQPLNGSDQHRQGWQLTRSRSEKLQPSRTNYSSAPRLRPLVHPPVAKQLLRIERRLSCLKGKIKLVEDQCFDSEQSLHTQAAVSIQRVYRGYCVRRKPGVVLIQRVLRRFLAQCICQRREQAAVTIQSSLRMAYVRRIYSDVRTAVVVLQRFYRALKLNKSVKS